MSAKRNPVIGAVINKDGKLLPVEGADPSSQWTYRDDEQDKKEPENRR